MTGRRTGVGESVGLVGESCDRRKGRRLTGGGPSQPRRTRDSWSKGLRCSPRGSRPGREGAFNLLETPDTICAMLGGVVRRVAVVAISALAIAGVLATTAGARTWHRGPDR